MKKFVFAVMIAAVAASPAMAAKKSKKAAAAAEPPPANSNEASWRLARDAFPIVLPSWAMPFYLNAKNQQKM